MAEKVTPVKDERAELAKLEEQLARKRFQVESKENFGGYDYSVPAEYEDTYESYMSKRSDQGVVRDGNGYRDTQTGNFASETDYYAGLESRDDYESRSIDRSIKAREANEKSYDDMSLVELAKKLGEAEATDDRSLGGEMSVLIDEKMDAHAAKYGWDQETKDAHIAKLLDIAEKSRSKAVSDATIEKKSGEPLSEGESLAAGILKAIHDNPELANEDVLGRLREIQVGYLPDNDTTRDEAFAEYETREGAPYDVDKGRVKDVDDAHDQALAQYETREGAPYDVDAGRVKDVDQARDEAFAEYETREGAPYDVDKGRVKDVEQAHIDAIEEAKGRVTSDEYNDDWDEAIAEEERRNRKWWKNPIARLSGLLTVGGWSLRERIENSNPRNRRYVLITLGAVAAVGVAYAIKNGLHSGGGGSHHTNDLSNGHRTGGTGIDHGSATSVHHDGAGVTPGSGGEFSSVAREVKPGEGWIQQLTDMGVPQSEQSSMLHKILTSEDPGIKEWVYKMSDGNPGIAHPGTIPDSVLESINALR